MFTFLNNIFVKFWTVFFSILQIMGQQCLKFLFLFQKAVLQSITS